MQQQQQHRNTGFMMAGNREMMQGSQMDQVLARRSFHGESLHTGAPMSRTTSLRPEDAGKNTYPSISPNEQMPYHQVTVTDGQTVHRPSLTPVQSNWPSDGPISSTSQSSSTDMMRSQSSSNGQARHRPAPLNLQHSGSYEQHSTNPNDRIQIEGSPFEPSFRSASAVGTPSYQTYQPHPGNRLHSIPSMSSPVVQTNPSPFYGGQQVSPYPYHQQHQQPQHQQPQHQQQQPQQLAPSQPVTSYSYSNGLPSMQEFAQPYQPSPHYQQHQQPYGVPTTSYLQPNNHPHMPPLPHMAHSAPSAIPQQSAATSAAYHQFQQQQRPSLLHTTSFPTMESSSSAFERPEYTGFSAYPTNRGQDRPHKCDQCTQSFNRNHDLKRHKRIHLEVKPFACSACQKQFSRRDALKRHWLVKNCDGDRSDPNNPAYVPPDAANRKNAAAIPRHYQTASKKAQIAKFERQQKLAQARKQANGNGSKESSSQSDRSKSSSEKEDDPMDVKGETGQARKSYIGINSAPPDLSPPTPSAQVALAPPYINQPGSGMARSTSHSTALITPDENAANNTQPKLGVQSASNPFLASHSQSVYSHLVPEKQSYQNGQYSNYDLVPHSAQTVGPHSASSSTSAHGSSLPASGGAVSAFSWQQQGGNYAGTSGPVPADAQNSQLNATSTGGIVRSTEDMVSRNNSYVNATSPVVFNTTPKPTRNSKDYFDGVVLSDKRAQPITTGSMSSDSARTDPALRIQPHSAQRPVFTMPFGTPDGPTGSVGSEKNASMDMSNMKGQWQRWHRPSFPFPVGQAASAQTQHRHDGMHDEINASSTQNSLHPGMQQPQPYARSSLRLSHSPNNNIEGNTSSNQV